MVDIYLHSEGNSEYSFESFHEKFLEICSEHRKTGRAMAFAFILYDFRNPQIAKILRDEDYWFSLHALSGAYLSVFSLNYDPAKDNIRKLMKEKMEGKPLTKYLTLVDTNPFALEVNSNILIQKYFGDVKVKFPSVLFFQVDNDTVIDSSLIELDERKIEDAFSELLNYVESAVDALKLITDDNIENHQQIFTNLESNVRSERTKIVTQRTIRKVTSVAELGSTIMGLRG